MQNNNHEKCAGIGFNGFIFKKTDKKCYNNEKKNPESRLGFACLVAQPIQPNLGGNWLDWLCYLAGKS